MNVRRWSVAMLIVFSGAVASRADTPAPPLHVVPEAWRSSFFEPANTDSLAVAEAGGRTLVFATAKEGDRIDVLDAATGRWLRSIGERGDAAMQFKRPNGVVVVPILDIEHAVTKGPPLVLVIERDGRRVQAFWADTFEHAGTFGHDELVKPYGGAVSYRGNAVTLFVTDNDVPPAEAIKRYRLVRDGRHVRADYLGLLGDADGPGALLKTESIAVDDRTGRVLICDEDKSRKNVKVYTLEGAFTGQTFGDKLVFGDPEGIGLLDDPQRGYVLLTDQQAVITIWHLFDRDTYQHLAAFTTQPFIANTDGIALWQHPVGEYGQGLLVAVHDDLDVRAYSLGNILDLVRNASAAARH